MKYFTKIRFNEIFYKLILRLGQIGLKKEGHLCPRSEKLFEK